MTQRLWLCLVSFSLSLSHSISLFLTLCQFFSHVSFLMPKSCWMGDGTTAQVRLWSTACYCSCFCLNLSLTFSVRHRIVSIFLFMLYLIGLVVLWHAKTPYIGHKVLYMSSYTIIIGRPWLLKHAWCFLFAFKFLSVLSLHMSLLQTFIAYHLTSSLGWAFFEHSGSMKCQRDDGWFGSADYEWGMLH